MLLIFLISVYLADLLSSWRRHLKIFRTLREGRLRSLTRAIFQSSGYSPRGGRPGSVPLPGVERGRSIRSGILVVSKLNLQGLSFAWFDIMIDWKDMGHGYWSWSLFLFGAVLRTRSRSRHTGIQFLVLIFNSASDQNSDCFSPLSPS